MVRYSLNGNMPVSIQVYDALGTEVKRISNVPISEGESSLQIEMGNIPAGIYLLRINTSKETVSQRISLVK